MSTQPCQVEAAGRTVLAEFVPALGEAGMWTFSLDGRAVRVAPSGLTPPAEALASTVEDLLIEQEAPHGT